MPYLRTSSGFAWSRPLPDYMGSCDQRTTLTQATMSSAERNISECPKRAPQHSTATEVEGIGTEEEEISSTPVLNSTRIVEYHKEGPRASNYLTAGKIIVVIIIIITINTHT